MKFYGADLMSLGGIAADFANTCHIYLAHNSFALQHRPFGETISLDAPGGFYYGPPAAVEPQSICVKEGVTVSTDRWQGARAVYVVSGPGMGQWRKVVGVEGAKLLLDRPWDVIPDQNSLTTIVPAEAAWLRSSMKTFHSPSTVASSTLSWAAAHHAQ